MNLRRFLAGSFVGLLAVVRCQQTWPAPVPRDAWVLLVAMVLVMFGRRPRNAFGAWILCVLVELVGIVLIVAATEAFLR